MSAANPASVWNERTARDLLISPCAGRFHRDESSEKVGISTAMAITLVLAVAALGNDPFENEAPLGPEAGCMMHSMAYKSVLRRITRLFSCCSASPPPHTTALAHAHS